MTTHDRHDPDDRLLERVGDSDVGLRQRIMLLVYEDIRAVHDHLGQHALHGGDGRRPRSALCAVRGRRRRDCQPDVTVLLDRTTGWSFLSDHCLLAAGTATGLLFVSRRLGA